MTNHSRVMFFFLLISLVMIAVPASSDTIKLYEGTVLVGKIIAEDKSAITFANSYGTFKIKRIRIDDMYETDSFEEDIAVHKKHKFPINVSRIKRNYIAGENRKEGRKRELIRLEEAKEKKEKAEQEARKAARAREKKRKSAGRKDTTGDHWTSGRLSFSGAFHYNMGSSQGSLPFGYAGYFALDQGFDFARGSRHPMIPGLRFEGGYVYFKRSSYSLAGYVFGGGLMWAFPSMKNSWGCIILALVPGASYLKAKIGGTSILGIGGSSKGFNFTGQAILGYQKSFGVFSIFIQARYMYIHGSSSYFHSIGGECGFGFNAW